MLEDLYLTCNACGGRGTGRGDSEYCGRCGGDGSVPFEPELRDRVMQPIRAMLRDNPCKE